MSKSELAKIFDGSNVFVDGDFIIVHTEWATAFRATQYTQAHKAGYIYSHSKDVGGALLRYFKEAGN